MTTIVQPTHYDQIRAAIDVSLTADDLPSSTIGQPIYLFAADAEVKRRVPGWATVAGDDAQTLLVAAIYLTAGRIASALPSIEREQFPEGYSYQRVVDYAARGAELLGAADQLVQSLINADEQAPGRPTIFAVASGRRGR